MQTRIEDGKRIVSFTAEELQAKHDRGATKTDWAAVDAMTEEEIQAAIASDPDDIELTEQEFKTAIRLNEV